MKDRRWVAWVVLVAATAAALAGCVAGGSSPAPTPVASSGLASPLVTAPAPGASASVSDGPAASLAPGTTATDWGVIRDAVPAGFPLPPGAAPADLPDGPVSGAWTTATPAADAAATIRAGLADAGWTDIAASGPTEGGEVTIDATGPGAGCRARVSVGPLGGLTSIVVLYGAACP